MKKKRTTRGDAITLTVATGIKSLVQLLTPIVLVRLLDKTEFGDFRVFWLVANTATLLLSLGMARSLLYFLPRSSPEERGRFVSQTALYFLGVSLLASLVLVIGEGWLSEDIAGLTEPGWVLPAFVFLWVASVPVRYLPNADQNVTWQAGAIVTIALLRAAAVLGTAVAFRDIHAVFVGLLVWSGIQFLILGYYVVSRYGVSLHKPTLSAVLEQFSFAAPFGLSQTLAGARRTVAQWIVVFLFSPASLAVFAIGTSFNAVLRLIRSSLGNVLLPKISKSQASGDMERAVRLNNRGNVAIFVLICPVLCWLWLYAESVITLMYTEDYVDAVPVLRVYLGVLLIMSIELGSVLMVLRQGQFVLLVSIGVLALASVASLVGGKALGLYGVALGSLVGEVIG
ncbi:MAG: oligosaccharide flippase family protein, partial [Pseudomonadota bacterium]